MWAITSNGIGKTVTARSIEPDWELAEGETFKVEVWEPGMIWDGATVRHPTEEELPALAPPITVSPWQLRKALNQLGLRAQVEQAVADVGDQNLKDGWEFATQFVRTDPFVVSMGQALGKTDADIDALFALAATL